MAVKKIVILRGISGSGKSTYGEKLVEEGTITLTVSADNYFTDDEGNYKFDPSKLKEAHGSCIRAFIETLHQSPLVDFPIEQIIVDNTNTQLWEMSPYVALAEAYRVPYEIVHVVCPVEVALERNVHDVPADTIRQQAERFEDPLPWWNSKTVSGVEE
jgi:tRNA uridine 5-carbamoylmethylation protein Kti12